MHADGTTNGPLCTAARELYHSIHLDETCGIEVAAKAGVKRGVVFERAHRGLARVERRAWGISGNGRADVVRVKFPI